MEMIDFTEKTQIVTYWVLVIRHWSLNCQESISRNFVSEIIYWVKGTDLRESQGVCTTTITNQKPTNNQIKLKAYLKNVSFYELSISLSL